ncbi:energy transducer TonB [Thiocystis violacea]|uniref:energy transducer TonB n=1 Tax=Thiocystis violacea TaxID=13725 RepID=UPI0019072B3C|nr:energy transducer TonB [Thiocystis violacea]MBK1718439.1 hypothetical protein [Thiocystis violacea]
MSRAPLRGGGLWLGLLLSAVLHTAIAAALLWDGTPVTPEPRERVVPLDLAMFGDGVAGGSDARPDEAPTPAPPASAPPADTEAKPEVVSMADPAPLPIAETSPALPIPPAPAVKPVADTPKPAPARAKAAPARKPAPPRTAATKPEAKPKARSTAKPTPAKPSKPARTASQKPSSAPSSKPAPSHAVASRSGQGPGASPRQGSSGQSASTATKAASERDYLNALQGAIARHQQYPMNARRQQQSGVATLAFVIRADGGIGQIRVAKSSGHSALDQAALQAMYRLGRFKPIPKSFGRQSWPLRVPIRFDLK